MVMTLFAFTWTAVVQRAWPGLSIQITWVPAVTPFRRRGVSPTRRRSRNTVPPAGFECTASAPVKTAGALGAPAGCGRRARSWVAAVEALVSRDADLVAAGITPGVAGAAVATGVGAVGIGSSPAGLGNTGLEAAVTTGTLELCGVTAASTGGRARRTTRPLPIATSASIPATPATAAERPRVRFGAPRRELSPARWGRAGPTIASARARSAASPVFTRDTSAVRRSASARPGAIRSAV